MMESALLQRLCRYFMGYADKFVDIYNSRNIIKAAHKVCSNEDLRSHLNFFNLSVWAYIDAIETEDIDEKVLQNYFDDIQERAEALFDKFLVGERH
jgi:biotin operon repressor